MSTRLYSTEAADAASADARVGTPTALTPTTRVARSARRWHVLAGMRKSSSWATRIVLIAGATGGVVAACYNDVPGPSGPLPPTREVSPQGPKPGPIEPAPAVTLDGGLAPTSSSPSARSSELAGSSRVVELNARFAPQAANPEPPTTTPPADAGVADAIELPPIPDSSVPLDAPGVKK